MKKLDRLILRSFLGPLVLTFAISVFVLLMQFVWKYIDDMVGKGIDFGVIVELLVYASATFVPMALPIAILFASIMTMGNFGEKYELVAMKAGGISVSRVMRPMIIVVLILTGVAFYFANNVMPEAMLRYRMTLYDITRKKPAVNIRPGEYYKDIEGYVIRVGSKSADGRTLQDIIIYDNTHGSEENTVITARSGLMQTTADNHYLLFSLQDGYTYTEATSGENYKRRPLTTISFESQTIAFDISSFAFDRSSEDLFKGSYQIMNVAQLTAEIKRRDSLLDDRRTRCSTEMTTPLHLWHRYIDLRPSLSSPPEADSLCAALLAPVTTTEVMRARNHVLNISKDSHSYDDVLRADQEYINRHHIERQRKFTLSIACLLLFLIGAPFGSIVRKGGLGLPLVASVGFFVLYYVVGMIAEKSVRESVLSPAGMWVSSIVMLPIGIFLTLQATTDSSLFDRATWRNMLRRLFARRRTGALPIIAMLLLPYALQAQTKKSEPLFEQAVEKSVEGRHEDAIRLLHRALDLDPTYAEALLLLGNQHLALQQYDLAAEAYSQCLQLNSASQRWRDEATQSLRTAQWRADAVAHPVPFKPINLGPNINTAADEYMPALTADYRTLVFTRRSPRNAQTRRGLPKEEDFYISLYDTMELSWQPATRMPEPLNSNDNEGAQTLSHDGRVVIFCACGRHTEPTGCDLYLSVRTPKGWSQPRNLGAPVNTVYWESYPSLSIDGRTLYFASNRSGGYGGTDIWCCTLEEGRWSEPRNLGPSINTSADETSPYIHFDDRTLYFSSKGHLGMGGSDLYVARRVDDTTWGTPQNLGYPINTPGDEVNLIVAPDGRTALFSSDRYGGYGQQDIYSFVMPAPTRPERITFIDPVLQAENLLTLGDTVTLPGIYFQTASDALLETSLANLDRLAEALRRHPTLRLEIGGHTDNVGSEQANQLLSERRAKAVFDYLVLCGVDPSRLAYRGYGESRPVASNDTPEGRAANRRTTLSPIR